MWTTMTKQHTKYDYKILYCVENNSDSSHTKNQMNS